MKGSRIAILLVGVLVGLVGFGLAGAGGGMLVAGMARADDGYLTTPEYAFTTDTAVLTSEVLHLEAPHPDDWLPWDGRLGVRFTVTPPEGRDVFVGVASAEQLDTYLDGIAHTRVTRLDLRPERMATTEHVGEGLAVPPASADLWVASVEGAGTQTLDVTTAPGSWAMAVIATDGSPGLDVTATAGTPAAPVLWLAASLLAVGFVLLAGATAMVVLATYDTLAPPVPAAPVAAAGTAGRTPAASTYPLRLSGRLDEPLNRGLWLVKWLLLLPHFIVLGFLWVAFVLLTIVAGFAILFTGRYPQGIFTFNVGVLRWSWRVAYYGYSALGTDQYPPFTLGPADYPATLDVAYPSQLSRGLVLVKWWLLAIPHYLVLAVLAGGVAWTASGTREAWSVGSGLGLIGLLAVFAGVAVLVTGRYPRGLHDLVVGCNRWVYRVIAYAALMTDRYPPFRLDAGGEDPEPAPLPPPPPDAGGVGQPELART